MKSMKLRTLGLLLGCSAMTAPVAAKEGMFKPDQLQEISGQLREAGLEIDPEQLADLTGFPMGAGQRQSADGLHLEKPFADIPGRPSNWLCL